MKYQLLFICLSAIFFLASPMKIENARLVKPKNVLGGKLHYCCNDPVTGFYRDGYCVTGKEDYGTHIVCAEMSNAFLDYSKTVGNDLRTALPPPSTFPGLKAGDKWCLSVYRWKEAYDAGFAPKVVLESTHQKVLEFVSLEVLKEQTTK